MKPVTATCTMVTALTVCMAAATAQGTPAPIFQAAAEPAASIASSLADDAQVKDDLLEGLDRIGANAKERNEVNLDKNMLALAGGKKGGRYADLSQKMDFITVRNYEFATKGQYQKSDLDGLRHRLEGDGWSHIVRNEGDGETNDIVVKADREGFVNDMVILNAEPKEVNIVHLRGHFRMDDLQGAMGSVMGAMGSAMGSVGGAIGGAAGASHTPPPPPPPPPAGTTDPALKRR